MRGRSAFEMTLARLKPAWTVGIAIAVLSLMGEAHAGLADEILGKWSYKGKQSGATIESIAEFQEGGTYICSMKVDWFGAKLKIAFKATWELEDETTVVIKVTETSNSLFLAKGKVMRKEGVMIENDVMAYRHAGKSESERRVIEAPAPPAERSSDVPAEASEATE